MAALDDRYDVLDYCQKHGLDYDSLRDQAKARAAMAARFAGCGTGKGGALVPSKNMLELWKARYGTKP